MNFESTNRDESSGKKHQPQIVQCEHLDGVCIRGAYAFAFRVFLLTRQVYILYVRIQAIFNHWFGFGFFFFLHQKLKGLDKVHERICNFQDLISP